MLTGDRIHKAARMLDQVSGGASLDERTAGVEELVVKPIGNPNLVRGYRVVGAPIFGRQNDRGRVMFGGEARFPVRRDGKYFQLYDNRGDHYKTSENPNQAREISHRRALSFARGLKARVRIYCGIKVVDSV